METLLLQAIYRKMATLLQEDLVRFYENRYLVFELEGDTYMLFWNPFQHIKVFDLRREIVICDPDIAVQICAMVAFAVFPK